MASNPLSEYLSVKTAAGPGDFMQGLSKKMNMRNAGGALGGALMGAGAAGAIGVAGFAAQKLVDAATKAHDFRQMLAFDANLAAKHEEDPRLVNQMFSTLRTFNPSFTKDPAVASSLVARMVDTPGGVSGMMGEVLPLRDKMRGQVGPVIMQGALGGVKGGGGGGKHQRGEPSE
jgi:hypothetical protein